MLNFLSKFGLKPYKKRHAVHKTASTPKPRAEGSSPSAPAKAKTVALGSRFLF